MKTIVFVTLLLGALYQTQAHDSCFNPQSDNQFEFTSLSYAYDALEPAISGQIMHLHHDKHYKGYTTKCNAAIQNTPMQGQNIDQVLKRYSSENTTVRNNCGGWHNHCLFWKFLQGTGKQTPQGKLGQAIEKAFGSYQNLQEQFDKASSGVFGSGWAWLVLKTTSLGGHFLEVCNTPNQDSPIFNENSKTTFAPCQGQIILALDVWEHAYYLQYYNVRADYINNFWNVVNWRYAEERFDQFYKNQDKVDLL